MMTLTIKNLIILAFTVKLIKLYFYPVNNNTLDYISKHNWQSYHNLVFF